jgi:hypothetical protein
MGTRGSFPGRGVKLTTHIHLVPTSRMRGFIPLLPNTPSSNGAQLKHRIKFTCGLLFLLFCHGYFIIIIIIIIIIIVSILLAFWLL